MAKAEEDFSKAQVVFEDLNQELLEELPVLYNSRIGCYVTVFQNISNLRDVFYREMSKLNHSLYEVMSKLEKQHSNKVFVVKGLSSSSRRSLVISPPVQTCTAFSPVSPVTSPTSPNALSVTSESESVSATAEELTSEAVGEDSCESEESLKDEEADEDQSETSSSEEEKDEDEDEDEEESLAACNGPTPTPAPTLAPASPAAEVKSQEEAAPCSPTSSLGRGQTGKEHSPPGEVVLRARASSEGAEQSKRTASVQRTSAPPSRPPPPKASGGGLSSPPGSAEASKACHPRASSDASSDPEPPETGEKEGTGSSGPKEPHASSTKSATQVVSNDENTEL